MTGLPAEVTERLAEALRGEGLSDKPAEFDSDIHSWRCSYPDVYGPCDCFRELVAALAPVVVAYGDERAREALTGVAAKLYRDHDMPPNKDQRTYGYRMGWWDGVHHAASIVERKGRALLSDGEVGS